MTKDQLAIMRHTLGLAGTGARSRPWRNNYNTDPGATDFLQCEKLVALGYMKHGYVAGMHYFFATADGIAATMKAQVPQ